jgi:subtilisin-like proprotein convertase family protein
MRRSLSLALCAGTSLAMVAGARAQYAITTATPGSLIPNVDVAANLVAGSQGDDNTVTFTLPAAYGNGILAAGSVIVGDNGFLVASAAPSYTNAALVSTNAKGYYPMWDDLLMQTVSSGFPTATIGRGNEGVFKLDTGSMFVIQWNGRTYNPDGSGYAAGDAGTGYQFKMQLQIHMSSDPSGTLAQFVYQGLGTVTGQSATVGLVAQAPAGTVVQYEFNTAGSLSDTTVLTVTAPTNGACCLPNGTCSNQGSQAACTGQGGVYNGDASSCATTTCPPAGACCLPNQTCSAVTQASCTTQGGTWAGANTTCATTVCPGRCCMPDNTCQITTDTACAAGNGVFGGSNTTCTGFACPVFGACCAADGTCSLTPQANCVSANGTFAGAGVPCASAGCAATGACCALDGTCSTATYASCRASAGFYAGNGVACGAAANCPHVYAYTGSPVTIVDSACTANLAIAEIVVPDAFTISGADAAFYISHTYQNDLRVSLMHVDTGTTVFLLDRVGLGNDNFGTPSVPFRSLDQAPFKYLVGTGSDQIPAYFADVSGDWRPQNPLAPLVGESSAGTWRLTAHDCAGADVGTVNSFSVALRSASAPPPACYANCDNSTAIPFLNVQDFSCFLTKYASGNAYANCDNSTTIPTLNVQDFSCFLTKYASGCSAP